MGNEKAETKNALNWEPCELKPCPFCGSKNVVIVGRKERRGFGEFEYVHAELSIVCENCNAQSAPIRGDQDKDGTSVIFGHVGKSYIYPHNGSVLSFAAECWNRRTPPEPEQDAPDPYWQWVPGFKLEKGELLISGDKKQNEKGN